MNSAREVHFSLKERIEFTTKWFLIHLVDTYMETYQQPGGEEPSFYRLGHKAAKNIFWNDRMESIVEARSLLPQRMDTYIKDGKGYRKESIIFERDRGIARFLRQDRESGQTLEEEVGITPNSMDPLCAFFNLRKRLSPNNPSLELEGTTGSRRFTLEGKLMGEEQINVPAGSFETYRYKCILQYWSERANGRKNGKKIEKRENNPFTLWVSQDDHRFPVQIIYNLPLGNLHVRATSVRHYDPV